MYGLLLLILQFFAMTNVIFKVNFRLSFVCLKRKFFIRYFIIWLFPLLRILDGEALH